jgi:hypothetical protein
VDGARLEDELNEVEGWYRLLQADHETLQGRLSRSGRRVTELQAEANRLAVENRELRALVDRMASDGPAPEATGRGPGEGGLSTMRRITEAIRSARRHKWAMAAVVAIATLLVRDAAVQDAFGSAYGRLRQAVRGDAGGDSNRSGAGVDSGYLRYAAMIHGREELERERREYNAREAALKGDALLEAQDRLRSARARDRQARRAFLPELARQCEQARVALPREAAEALATLNVEAAD